MHVAFRVDASREMGSGHLARCLSLGQVFVELGWQVRYVVRQLDNVALQMMTNIPASSLTWLKQPDVAFGDPKCDAPAHCLWAGVSGIQDAAETIKSLAEFRPKWIIVDHYAFDCCWHEKVAGELGCNVGAIDDLGDRCLNVRLLIDPNWDVDHSSKYANRLSSEVVTLFGPRFALLSNIYRAAEKYRFSEAVRSIGIFLGGTDIGNYSLVALKACLDEIHFEGDIEVLTRSTNPNLECLKKYSSQYSNVRISLDLPDLAGFFARHDIQIGAGGGATWERCCIGAPSVLLAFAENQRRVVNQAVALGLAAGVDVLDSQSVANAVRTLIKSVSRRRQMSKSGQALVDGYGCLRVALSLSGECIDLRCATQDDAGSVFGWRNAESTRRYFRDPGQINIENHVKWWRDVIARPDQFLLIGGVEGHDVGVVRIDLQQQEEAEVSIYLAPGLTGLGLGAALLRTTESWAMRELRVRRLCADIDPQNEKSAHAFEAAGYVKISSRLWTLELRP